MIKQILFVVIAFHLCSRIVAQNLVPNYSFETFSSCPGNPGEFYKAIPWYDPTNATTDYFNACGASCCGVPINGGIQVAQSGVAYAGIIVFTTFSNQREYIQVELSDTLTPGVLYRVSFYVNLFGHSNYSVSNMGAHLSQQAINSTGPGQVLSVLPQISNPLINQLNDTLSWILISDTLTAAGDEKFITIGNFDTDIFTDSLSTGFGYLPAAYYYIDDVSVIPDSLTGVHDLNFTTNSISIYPNPASEEINIITTHNQNEAGTIVIENVLGQELMTRSIVAGENNLKVSVSELAPGIYIYREIINGVQINSGKIIIER